MDRQCAISMFRIVDGWRGWDEGGFFRSYYEYEAVKSKIIDGDTLTFQEKQDAYNVVQSMRFYFNAHIDDTSFGESFRKSASEFDLYYRLFILEYYSKSMSDPRNNYNISGKANGCYIATAVYGLYDCPDCFWITTVLPSIKFGRSVDIVTIFFLKKCLVEFLFVLIILLVPML